MIELPGRLVAGPLAVRVLRAEDAAAYVQAFADDPQLGRFIGVEHDPTVEGVRDRVAGADSRAAEGKGLELAVVDGDDRFAGSLVAHSFAWTHRRCEIGFWVLPGVRGRGLATTAVARLLDWIFAELPIDRVEMTTTPDNVATRALARRLGFTQEGIQRKRNVERGRRVDLVLFGLLAADWRTRALEPTQR